MQSFEEQEMGPKWYTQPYILVTILISVVAAGFAAVLLLVLFALPWSSEILRFMQAKMLTLKSVDVVADVAFTGASARKGADGSYQSSPEALKWHSGGTFNMSDPAELKARHQFQMKVGSAPAYDFAGIYVREGDVDYFDLTTIPERFGPLQLGKFKGKWLRLERKKMLEMLTIPLVGQGFSPMSNEDAKSLADQFRKTKFFKVAERLPDEAIDGVAVFHYKVQTDDGNLLMEDFYEKVMAARLKRPLNEVEKSAARTLFAGTVLKDCEFWIGTRDYFLYRATFAVHVDNGVRRGDMNVDLRFSNFNRIGNTEVGSDDVTDVTSFVLSLLSGLQQHLPMAKIGEVQRGENETEGGLNTNTGGSGASMSQSDSDRDGLSDSLEAFYGTNPSNQDSDNDGVPDGSEVEVGCNPSGPGKLFDFGITNEKGACK